MKAGLFLYIFAAGFTTVFTDDSILDDDLELKEDV